MHERVRERESAALADVERGRQEGRSMLLTKGRPSICFGASEFGASARPRLSLPLWLDDATPIARHADFALARDFHTTDRPMAAVRFENLIGRRRRHHRPWLPGRGGLAA